MQHSMLVERNTTPELTTPSHMMNESVLESRMREGQSLSLRIPKTDIAVDAHLCCHE